MNSVIDRLRTRRMMRLSSMLLAGGSLVSVAQAQTNNWLNGGADANTGTASNWSATLGTSSILTFGSASFSTTITNNATFTSYAGLVFNSDAQAYTINSTSTAVSLLGDITQSAANTQIWNGGVTWTGAARTLSVASGGVMQFGSTTSAVSHVITGGTGTNKATMTGSGEVKFLSNTSGTITIANTVNGDVDMSGLAKFTAQTGTLSIGSGATASTGTITLSANTSLTATVLKIGDTLGGSVINNPTVKMGATTTINADTINLGSTRSSGTLSFNATSGSTVTIRGTAGGTTKANITLGYYQTSPGTYNPTGTMNFTGGSVDARIGELVLGRVAPAGAVSGNNALNQGTFTMPAGTVIADTVRLGYYSGGSTGTSGGGGLNFNALGTLNLSGGTFTVNTAMRVGDGQVSNATSITRGVINLSGGQLNIGVGTTAATFLLGFNNGTNAASNQRGTLNITGGTLTTNTAILSSNGQSTLTLNGGTLDMGGNGIGSASTTQQIGQNGGSLNFQSGTLLNVNGINGSAGLTKTTTGTLTLLGTMVYTGATTVSDGTLRLGNGGTTGQLGNAGQDVTLTAATSLLEINRSDSASIANKITGAGGVKVTSGTITLGNAANDYAGVTTLAGGTLSVGTISNGGAASALGAATNAASNLLFDGGKLQFTGVTGSSDRNFTITNGKTATFDVANGSTLTMSGGVSSGTGSIAKEGAGTLILSGSNANTGTTTVTAGTLQVGAGAASGSLGSGAISINNGALLVINRSDAISVSNDISGGGGLQITGAGTVTMTGNLSYTGNTSVTGLGGLIVNGTMNGSAVTVDTFLGGNGTYTAAMNVSASGTIAAGNSIGTMNFGNGLTMNGAMNVELDGNTNLADLYNVTGLLTIGNGATLNFTQLNPVTGSAYVFAKYSSWNGQQFTNINGTPVGWTVDYNYNDGTSTNNFALVAVPEPGAIALSMVGGLLLFGRRKRA